MRKKAQKKPQTILDIVIENMKQLAFVRDDILIAKGSPENSGVREKHLCNAIKGLAEIEDLNTALSEWWKMEYFKRQWISGFCYPCYGTGKTNDPKHPTCKDCRGRGNVGARKPKGNMIPDGWKVK